MFVFLVINDFMAAGRAEVRPDFLKVRLLTVGPAVDHDGWANPLHFFLPMLLQSMTFTGGGYGCEMQGL